MWCLPYELVQDFSINRYLSFLEGFLEKLESRSGWVFHHAKNKEHCWTWSTMKYWLVLQIFFNVHPDPWANDPIWLIFFKWVETTKLVKHHKLQIESLALRPIGWLEICSWRPQRPCFSTWFYCYRNQDKPTAVSCLFPGVLCSTYVFFVHLSLFRMSKMVICNWRAHSTFIRAYTVCRKLWSRNIAGWQKFTISEDAT